MRRILPFLGTLFVAGCSSASGASNSDAGSGADAVAQLSADDYRSFELSWHGTGVGERFFMDHDCGVEASAYGGGQTTGSGVVAATDCRGFETLVTSDEMVAALTTQTRNCTDVSDDYGNYTLTLVDGGKLQRETSGCSDTEPFRSVRAEIHRLEALYAPLHGDDAGDGGDGGDATTGDAAADGG